MKNIGEIKNFIAEKDIPSLRSVAAAIVEILSFANTWSLNKEKDSVAALGNVFDDMKLDSNEQDFLFFVLNLYDVCKEKFEQHISSLETFGEKYLYCKDLLGVFKNENISLFLIEKALEYKSEIPLGELYSLYIEGIDINTNFLFLEGIDYDTKKGYLEEVKNYLNFIEIDKDSFNLNAGLEEKVKYCISLGSYDALCFKINELFNLPMNLNFSNSIELQKECYDNAMDIAKKGNNSECIAYTNYFISQGYRNKIWVLNSQDSLVSTRDLNALFVEYNRCLQLVVEAAHEFYADAVINSIQTYMNTGDFGIGMSLYDEHYEEIVANYPLVSNIWFNLGDILRSKVN